MAGISNLLQGARFAKSVVPQSINGTDTDGTAMDCQGYKSACFIFHAGAIGAADFDNLALKECDTSGGTYTAVTGGAFTAPTQTSDDGFWVAHVDLRKRQRFMKWRVDPGAAASLVCAFVILYDGEEAANSATERNVTQTLVL